MAYNRKNLKKQGITLIVQKMEISTYIKIKFVQVSVSASLLDRLSIGKIVWSCRIPKLKSFFLHKANFLFSSQFLHQSVFAVLNWIRNLKCSKPKWRHIIDSSWTHLFFESFHTLFFVPLDSFLFLTTIQHNRVALDKPYCYYALGVDSF